MSVQTHVVALNKKHAEIENIIAQEELRPQPDTMRLTQLKKQKLRLKEELSKIDRTHH